MKINNEIIPMTDLYAQYQTIKEEIDYVIKDVIRGSMFVRGHYVEKFEQIFANMMEREYCVSCGNGTDSLFIAMKALGVKPGDEVIAPAHSWISTTETISQAGGKVIFCDTESDTYTIDPNAIEEKITSRTVGIIPVHLYGQPADMDKIMKVANKFNLWVLEDCAQAHLARYKGKLVGTFGNAASYSFYPGKNLGAMGDAGALVTNDKQMAEQMARFARHGGLTKGEHDIEGINSRMDGLQAAILTVKSQYLKRWTKLRQDVAENYNHNLKNIQIPVVRDGSEHVWHLYVIKSNIRDKLQSYLHNNGVSTSINYPTCLPLLKAYKSYGYQSRDFPSAYDAQGKILSLPLYPELGKDNQSKIITLINEFNAANI